MWSLSQYLHNQIDISLRWWRHCIPQARPWLSKPTLVLTRFLCKNLYKHVSIPINYQGGFIGLGDFSFDQLEQTFIWINQSPLCFRTSSAGTQSWRRQRPIRAAKSSSKCFSNFSRSESTTRTTGTHWSTPRTSAATRSSPCSCGGRIRTRQTRTRSASFSVF